MTIIWGTFVWFAKKTESVVEPGAWAVSCLNGVCYSVQVILRVILNIYLSMTSSFTCCDFNTITGCKDVQDHHTVEVRQNVASLKRLGGYNLRFASKFRWQMSWLSLRARQRVTKRTAADWSTHGGQVTFNRRGTQQEHPEVYRKPSIMDNSLLMTSEGTILFFKSARLMHIASRSHLNFKARQDRQLSENTRSFFSMELEISCQMKFS